MITSFLQKIILKAQKEAQLNLLRKHSDIIVGKYFKLGNYAQFIIPKEIQSLEIGENVEIRNNFSCVMGKDARLSIGNTVFMNKDCSINALESIEIGENTLFGEGVKLYDHNHRIQEKPEFEIKHREFNTAPIVIGRNCWLGTHVIVLKGVTIGENSVIGAGCVIHKDVPAHSKIVNQQNVVNLNS